MFLKRRFIKLEISFLALRALFKKETMLFFFSSIAWVVAFFFLFAWGGFFFIGGLSSVFSFSAVVENMSFLLVFFCPLVTMRLIAEEKKQKTLELLLSSSLSVAEIIIGKYFAVLFFYICLLAASFFVPLYFSFYASFSVSEVFLGYAELFFLGAALLGIGVLASSVSENQIIAALLAFLVGLFFYLMHSFSGLWGGDWFWRYSLGMQLVGLRKGIFELKAVVYFFCIIVFMLWLAGIFLSMYREKK